jgi:integrase
MARIKLTAGRIRDFTTDKAQAFLWDSEAPGLAVRATPSGKSAFIFQGKLNGKDIRCTIGECGTWGIDQAREEARRLGTLIDQGIDPREQKRERIAASVAKKEEERRHDATVGEAWTAYLEARKPKWSVRHYADHLEISRIGGEPHKHGSGKIEPQPIAALLPLKLRELSPERVAAWLETENIRRPTRAALAYRLLRAFLRWAASMPDFKAATQVEAVGTRVAKDHLHRVKAKEADSLQREQLATWFQAVRQLGNPVQSAYLQGLLLTGARREELAGLRWQDVDFQWQGLTIRDKVEGERIIPLTPYFASLIYNLPRRNDAEGKPVPWVFSSPAAASGRIQEPRAAHTRALEVAGLPHLSLHGLRRSFGTLAEWTETPVGVVAQIMGHKPSAIAEKHYRRRPLDLLRKWHTRIEAWILEQAGIEQPKEEQAGLRLVNKA